MNGNRTQTLLTRIREGYLGILKSFLVILAIIAASLVSGCIIVFPLWYLSSSSPQLYSLFVGILLLSGAALLLFLRLRRAASAYPSFPDFFRQSVLPFFRKTGVVFLALLGLYGVAVLFALSLYLIAVPAGILYLLLLGYLLFGKKHGRNDFSRER